MTIRWMGQSIPADEDWLDVSYLPPPGKRSKPRVGRFTWNVFRQKSADVGKGCLGCGDSGWGHH
jgi:hypothetical protein